MKKFLNRWTTEQKTEEVIHAPQRFFSWFFSEIKFLLKVLVSSADRFYWDDGFARAASMAYTTLFALVPITTICFAFLASFRSVEGYLPGIQAFVFQQFVPSTMGADQVLHYINEFSQTVASLNVVVIPFLVVTSILLLNSIEYMLNRVWQVFEPRTIAHRISIFCAILVMAPIIAISAYYTTQLQVTAFFQNFSSGENSFFVRLYHFLLPALIDFIAFACLYYLVPKAPVRFRSATTGAFFAAILFDFAKGQFALYITYFTSYEKIYGTLAAIPIFLFWLYLAWVIVLFGAEVSFQAQNLPRVGKLWKRTLLSVGDGRLVLAIQALIIIGRAYRKGEALPNEHEIAEELGCSSVVLKPSLESLKKADILARGDSREMPIIFCRSPDRIFLSDIRQAVVPQVEQPAFAREIASVFQAFDNHEEERVSLGNILEGERSHKEKNESN